MSWMYCGTDWYGREIGYGILATCDQRGCDKEIDRGLGCVCGEMHHTPWDAERGCGRYYCEGHRGWLGPRGGCRHPRGPQMKAWGRTKCQLMSRPGKETPHFKPEGGFTVSVGLDIYYCGCREWEYEGPTLFWNYRTEYRDPWLYHPRRVAGYVEHVEQRGFACAGALDPEGEERELLTI